MSWNIKKVIADEFTCYFYNEKQISQFIWLYIFLVNAEDMESQSADNLWSNYNKLILTVKLSPHFYSNCHGIKRNPDE